jgi:hypothetical protein
MGEILRTLPGIGEPQSPAAWGALARRCVELQIIEPVPNKFFKSSSPQNHAHKYQVYRRVRARRAARS